MASYDVRQLIHSMNLTVFTVFIFEDFVFFFFFYLKPPGENFYWYVSWETAKIKV